MTKRELIDAMAGLPDDAEVRVFCTSLEMDGGYDICSLDEDGHLHCSDETHGILAWSDKDGCYC